MSTSFGLITINAEVHDGEQVKYEVRVEDLSPSHVADAAIALMDKAIELGGPLVAAQALERNAVKIGATVKCNCPSCVARRKDNASNPSVN